MSRTSIVPGTVISLRLEQSISLKHLSYHCRCQTHFFFTIFLTPDFPFIIFSCSTLNMIYNYNTNLSSKIFCFLKCLYHYLNCKYNIYIHYNSFVKTRACYPSLSNMLLFFIYIIVWCFHLLFS